MSRWWGINIFNLPRAHFLHMDKNFRLIQCYLKHVPWEPFHIPWSRIVADDTTSWNHVNLDESSVSNAIRTIILPPNTFLKRTPPNLPLLQKDVTLHWNNRHPSTGLPFAAKSTASTTDSGRTLPFWLLENPSGFLPPAHSSLAPQQKDGLTSKNFGMLVRRTPTYIWLFWFLTKIVESPAICFLAWTNLFQPVVSKWLRGVPP